MFNQITHLKQVAIHLFKKTSFAKEITLVLGHKNLKDKILFFRIRRTHKLLTSSDSHNSILVSIIDVQTS